MFYLSSVFLHLDHNFFHFSIYLTTSKPKPEIDGYLVLDPSRAILCTPKSLKICEPAPIRLTSIPPGIDCL